MKDFLYWIVECFAKIHNKILELNDGFSHTLTDKELHFIVIGLVGVILVLIIQPLFKKLASTGHSLVITWVYVFTLIIGITFAIEIGQGITGTGQMDFADIVFGIFGFVVIFAIYAGIRGIVLAIKKGSKKRH
ncbi:MAG: hypothetical protein MJ145_03610 [Clostridia bacterium]|nr:hypothetical protein [Clostridia bacterium]